MLDESARGVYIISVTPFDKRGSLDLDGTDRLIDFYAGCGADGLTILGMMGEAPKLAHEEAVAFARRVIARAGKLRWWSASRRPASPRSQRSRKP